MAHHPEVPTVVLGLKDREQNERAEDKRWVKFDFTININTLIAAAALIITIISYGNKIVTYLHGQNTKINIMWAHWYTDNNSLLSPEEKQLLNELIKENN